MKTLALSLGLREGGGIVEEYRSAHAAVPSGVTDGLRAAGVIRMEIFLLGARLFMRLEVEDDFDPATSFAAVDDRLAVAGDADYDAFGSRMRALQEPLPEAAPGEWWALMEKVFEFDIDAEASR
jgi:L-rhamnose mutarotase